VHSFLKTRQTAVLWSYYSSKAAKTAIGELMNGKKSPSSARGIGIREGIGLSRPKIEPRNGSN
jgi:hypothetical protein